jgi:hypothetical protein
MRAEGRIQKFEGLELMAETPSKAVVAGTLSILRFYGENDPQWPNRLLADLPC